MTGEAASFSERLRLALATGWGWLLRKPCPMARLGLSEAEREQWIAATLLAIGLALFSAFFLDTAAIDWVTRWPQWLVDVVNRFTDFGRASYMLWPLGMLLLGCALVGAMVLPAWQYRVLAAVAVRIEFLFAAIAVPGLFTTVVKRLIGRGRPLTEAEPAVWLFSPLTLSNGFSSMPSGHATAAFAALVAAGSLWPRAIPFLWVYAVAVGISRVVVLAHFMSDVVIGALVGGFGALLVRNAFAARRLVFYCRGGMIEPKPGPSRRRLEALVRAATGR